MISLFSADLSLSNCRKGARGPTVSPAAFVRFAGLLRIPSPDSFLKAAPQSFTLEPQISAASAMFAVPLPLSLSLCLPVSSQAFEATRRLREFLFGRGLPTLGVRWGHRKRVYQHNSHPSHGDI